LRAAPKASETPVAAPPPAPKKLAVLPPPGATPHTALAAPDKPQINVIRGSRQPVATQRAPEQRRLASLPPVSSPAKTATDAPPIIVLRGRNTRYALASRPVLAQPAAHPLLSVVRGARPRPVNLERYVQPGPLILRVPN
jgi:hypothetical protein